MYALSEIYWETEASKTDGKMPFLVQYENDMTFINHP